MDRPDRSVFAVFGSVLVRFGTSSFFSRSGPTPSPKLSVLHIGPNRTETEPMLSIPDLGQESKHSVDPCHRSCSFSTGSTLQSALWLHNCDKRPFPGINLPIHEQV